MNKKLLILLIALVSSYSYAGQSCEGGAKDIVAVGSALEFSQKTIDKLNALNAPGRVFIVGRMGQDLSKYNLKYSHGAFVYKKGGDWVAVHELNGCGTAESAIYNEGLANFFLDDMYRYESSISVVDDKYSGALLDIVKSDKTVSYMHNPNYNMMSYPFATKYQNSNGFLLETMISAIAKSKGINITSREQAQGFLKTTSYTGDIIEINALTRLGARVSKANVAFDDQPFDKRMAGQINTVTFDGIIKFFQDNNYVSSTVEIN